MTEIDIRRADSLTASLAEPEPTLTLSQVRALLADAAAFERASRPIVLHTPAQPVTAAQSAPQPVPVSVPAAPLTGPVRVSRLFLRSEVVAYSALYTGAGAAVTGMVRLFADSPMVDGLACVGGLLVSLGAAVAANRAHDRHHAERGARARIGRDKHGCPVTEA